MTPRDDVERMCSLLEESAVQIENDATQAQVGPFPHEVRSAAAMLRTLMDERDAALADKATAERYAAIVAGDKLRAEAEVARLQGLMGGTPTT